MKFFDREDEINKLREIRDVSQRAAQFTVLTGRRRIGKTSLVMKESEQYTHIDSWWDRKGENEIDIIAADDLAKRVTFYEVKRQREELDMKLLKDKVHRFMESTGMYGKYEVGVDGLCMEEM